MRALALIGAVCLAAAASLPTTSALAGPLDEPTGLLCGYSSQESPLAPPARIGELDGGPVTGTGTLTCTFQIDSGYHGGTENDTFAASASGVGVVVLPPTTFTYTRPPGVVTFVCTQFTPESGPTLYWDDDWTTGEASWSTDPAASCSPAEVNNDCVCPYWSPDMFVCPLLDLVGLGWVWGCPPARR